MANVRSSRAPSRIRTLPHSIGWNSHLCGSRVTESARSIPASSARPFGVERGEAAVSRVDVQPQPFLGADVGQVIQGVDGAGVGGSGAGAQGERDAPGAAVGADGGGHRLG